MDELNDTVLALIQQHSLKDVLKAASVACARMAQFAADDDEMDTVQSDAAADRWETDEKTIDAILPMIVNEDAGL